MTFVLLHERLLDALLHARLLDALLDARLIHFTVLEHVRLHDLHVYSLELPLSV